MYILSISRQLVHGDSLFFFFFFLQNPGHKQHHDIYSIKQREKAGTFVFLFLFTIILLLSVDLVHIVVVRTWVLTSRVENNSQSFHFILQEEIARVVLKIMLLLHACH